MRQQPLILAIALLGIGWASGGGAAQILFTLFGEVVFDRGPAGIGVLWGCAGIGLIVGGTVAHQIGPRIAFPTYKRLVAVCYLVHGAAYIVFSQMESFGWALVFIGLSRAAVAVSSVLNTTLLLRHVADSFRGRVFSTNESLVWATMMLSMLACRARVAARERPHDRRLVRRPELDDGCLLAVGRQGGPARRACSGGHGSRRRGGEDRASCLR